jgi:hypothetical protein
VREFFSHQLAVQVCTQQGLEWAGMCEGILKHKLAVQVCTQQGIKWAGMCEGTFKHKGGLCQFWDRATGKVGTVLVCLWYCSAKGLCHYTTTHRCHYTTAHRRTHLCAAITLPHTCTLPLHYSTQVHTPLHYSTQVQIYWRGVGEFRTHYEG